MELVRPSVLRNSWRKKPPEETEEWSKTSRSRITSEKTKQEPLQKRKINI